MHNEMLQVEGKKMSKSLGNFFTVRDLLEQGVPGEVIRFVFLSHALPQADGLDGEEGGRRLSATLRKWYSRDRWCRDWRRSCLTSVERCFGR